MTADRAGYIAGLRKLADVLEAHPEIPLPYHGTSTPLSFMFFECDGSDRTALADAARAMPCRLEKRTREYGDGTAYFDLLGSLDGLMVELTAMRDAVCTRREAGTEEREVEETVTPAVTRKVTKHVPVYEWDCSPVLGGEAR